MHLHDEPHRRKGVLRSVENLAGVEGGLLPVAHGHRLGLLEVVPEELDEGLEPRALESVSFGDDREVHEAHGGLQGPGGDAEVRCELVEVVGDADAALEDPGVFQEPM